MLKYIAKRILYIVFVFLMMSIVIFALYSAVPGDPAMMKVAPLKDTMTDEQFEIIYQNTRKT